MVTDFEHEFKARKRLHLKALEEFYQKLVDAAYGKEYASRTYCKSLFDPILRWKDNSDYFKRIIGLVIHYSRLNPSDVMNPVIQDLQPIKDEFYEFLPIGSDEDEEIEPDLYFLELDNMELVDHIAQFVAAVDLSKKYTSKVIESPSPAKSDRKKQHRFTRNQQLLAIYYTLKSMGIEPRRTADMTHYSKLVHLMTGVDFDKVQNDIFYSKVKNLPHILTDQYLKRDLEFIRNYFLNVDAISIVEIIDTEINGCEN